VKQTIHFILIGVLLAALAIAVNAYLGARDDATKLTATLSQQNGVITKAANEERDRDKIVATAVAAIEAQKRRTRTPQQTAKAISQDLPELPLPIITLPSETSIQKPVDEPGSTDLVVPAEDLKPLYNHLEDCQICALDRDAAKQDVADLQKQNEALTKERDAAITSAKDGTFWQRAKRAVKWFTIGAAIGASAAVTSHHRI